MFMDFEKEVTQGAEKILATRFFQDGMFSLVKALLCVRKTPNEINDIFDKVRELIGVSSQKVNVFEGFKIEGLPLDFSKPLNEMFHKSLLYHFSLEVLEKEFKDIKKEEEKQKE